jgi:hypothetical protein
MIGEEWTVCGRRIGRSRFGEWEWMGEEGNLQRKKDGMNQERGIYA